jgi:hypothetical protein
VSLPLGSTVHHHHHPFVSLSPPLFSPILHFSVRTRRRRGTLAEDIEELMVVKPTMSEK